MFLRSRQTLQDSGDIEKAEHSGGWNAIKLRFARWSLNPRRFILRSTDGEGAMSKSKGKVSRVSESQRNAMVNAGAALSGKKRKISEVHQSCTSDSIHVPVELPRLDSRPRASDLLADSALNPALHVECELPSNLKETSADEMPISPTKKKESVYRRVICCAQSAMHSALAEMTYLEKKAVEAETEIRG